MSNVWWRELRGWCKSFTRTEAYLSILQLIFSIVLISLLIFVILHLLACNVSPLEAIKSTTLSVTSTTTVTGKLTATQPVTEKVSIATQTVTKKVSIATQTETVLVETQPATETISTESHPKTKKITISTKHESENISTKPTPLPKGVKCTWTPSHKTTPVTHYYDHEVPITVVPKMNVTENVIRPEFFIENSDGVPASNEMKGHLLALVKLRSPQDVTFGCILTMVAEKWTLTAASCIEAIEELDSLDSFVMMEGFDEETQGRLHVVSDIMIHPLYQGTNRSYDLAALKSVNSLINERSNVISLTNLIDYLSVTIAERLTLLGYGKFRSSETEAEERGLREVGVRRLPREQCADAWAPRHLAGGRRVARGPGGDAALCAGAAAAAAAAGACSYCAGAALVRRGALLGIMSDNPACGLACPPALYVNIALRTGGAGMGMSRGLVACSVLMAVFVAGALGVALLQLVTAATTTDDFDDILHI